jgi:hypothetical protein
LIRRDSARLHRNPRRVSRTNYQSPRKNAKSVPNMVAKMVANRPVLPQATCPPSTTQSLCGSPSVALQSSTVRSLDLPSGDPRICIQCAARYLSELNPVSWPVQPVSDLIRRRSGRKVVEGRRWRGLNGQSHPRSFPRAPVRPGAGNSIMASSVTSSSTL